MMRMLSRTVTFMTGNASKLEEVKVILDNSINLSENRLQHAVFGTVFPNHPRPFKSINPFLYCTRPLLPPIGASPLSINRRSPPYSAPMSVRFKFRSSVAFDSADLDGRASISVRDLRAKIVAQKHLQLCPDSDLVLSDAITGQVFEDEEFEIPEGSSVIIKRVPADRSLHLNLTVSGNAGSLAAKHAGFVLPSPSEDVDAENFDDFGIDLNPIFEASSEESDAEVSKSKIIIENKDDAVLRSSKASIYRCQNFERSDISEAMSKGIMEKSKKECGNEEDNRQIKLKLKEADHKLLDESHSIPTPAMLNTNLPTELICSLCNTIIKEAVMIPCCQYSFCDKCIRSALVERARCPKCFSLKCKVEDLLPNLTLRQAIERFLETQVAVNGADNVMTNAPDVESGIQAKEASCAISVRQKDLGCLYSAGRGSNQAMAESAYENVQNAGIGSHLIGIDARKPVKSSPSSLKIKPFSSSSAEALKQKAGFEAANLTTQRKMVPSVAPLDGSGVSMAPSMHRKGDRTCYRCGSPNHFVRFCPEASNPYPLLQTGDTTFSGVMPTYGQSYWHGASVPHMRPYANIFGAPGMMQYDPAMVPLNPFGISSYMQSLYTSMPVPYGYMRMGGMPPSMMAGTERPLTRAEFMDLQDGERNRKVLNEYSDREVDYDDISDNGNRRKLHEQRHHLEKEATKSCSDRDSQMLHKKRPHDRHFSPGRRPVSMSDEEIHSVDAKLEKRSQLSGRDDRSYYSKKSSLDLQDLSESSQPLSREKKRHIHKSCSKKPNEKKLLCGSESSPKSHHRSRPSKSADTEKVANDIKKQRQNHRYSPESGFEPDHSGYRKHHHKEKESSQSLRHSRQKVNSKGNKLEDDRWEMGDGLGEDYRGHYHHKRKRLR